MSQVAGLLSRRGEDVTRKLLEILGNTGVCHDAYGIATPSGAEHNPHRPGFTSLTACTALGHRLIKVHPTDGPQPMSDGGKATAFAGRLWDTREPATPTVTKILRKSPEEGLQELLTEHVGAWTAVIADEENIWCARDAIGSVPLYHGRSEEFIGISTDTKTILSLGMAPQRVKPGHIVQLGGDEEKEVEVATLEEPPQVSMSLDDATDELDRQIERAVSRVSRGLNSPTLAFSGGIDSTIIAYYLKRSGVRPKLTCIGSTDSPDPLAAESAADALGLGVRTRTITEAELEENICAILRSVEEADPMKAGAAAPLYFVALDAAERSSRVVFSGNGSDELLGGYAKYVQEYQDHGDKVRDTMFRDVAQSYGVNLERDWKICSDLGLELRLPFIDPDLTRFALGLPLRYKLPSEGREPRKMILRNLAKRLGLPGNVVEKPKKAAQYSSGTGKMIERLAKKRGRTVAGYLSERLNEAMGVK